MGVPRFYWWLINKYPQHEFVTQDMPNRTDWLYLDANCLFHPVCFDVLKLYPDETDPDRLQLLMFKRIAAYIEFLLEEADPQKGLYVSVDGVAPLAKMHQQRERRFRSATEAEIVKGIKKAHGKDVTERWSNIVITPGTLFMEQLLEFLANHFKRVKEEHKIQVIFSTYHTPGEGEHKILDHIRNRNLNPEWDEETYVIYGLDADLLFLTLSSQRKNLFLMREMNQLDKKKETKKDIFDDIDDVSTEINFVNIDVMGQLYIDQLTEIIANQSEEFGIPFDGKMDSRALINDFIFICYFLGNDFLPHIPSIDIVTGGLDQILNMYAEIYLTNGKKHIINLVKDEESGRISRVEISSLAGQLVGKLAELESDYFKTTLPKHLNRIEKRRIFESDPLARELKELEFMKRFRVDDPVKLGVGKDEEWKHRYYSHHFKLVRNQSQLVTGVCRSYTEGLVWVANYYFVGCPDWRWQYQFTHAPFISDLYAFLNKNSPSDITFSNRRPMAPCNQLLAVVPPVRRHVLPKTYQKLITDIESPILDYYPESITLDMLYKDRFWLCVPLLSVIDPYRIEAATRDLKLTASERGRNRVMADMII